MKAREAIEKTQHENRIMEAIKDAGRDDLLDEEAVIIPSVGLESAVVWFDDSYNTMIESGGEWLKPSGGEWLKQAREYVLAAGYVWHYDCEPPAPASAYIPEPAAGYGWRSKAAKAAAAGHTPGEWKAYNATGQGQTLKRWHVKGPAGQITVENMDDALKIAAAPELLAALKDAKAMLETAGHYFPKSIRNGDRFSLMNVLANSIEPAIAKAEGK